MSQPPFSRQRLSQGCNPAPAGPPQALYTQADECAQLPFLKAAFNAVVTGIVPQEIRDDTRWIQYQRANPVELRKLITRLESICNSYGPRYALRAGGINRRGFNPW